MCIRDRSVGRHVETAKEVPQAFSHFTWEYSNQMILVCDIQGVDHYFTDPQIHSHDGKSFGMGNIGMEGINKFLETHKCNSICKKVRYFMKCFYAGLCAYIACTLVF